MKKELGKFRKTIRVNVEYPYLIYFPASQETKEGLYPLLIFLHGAGERGDDLTLIRKYGPPKHIESGHELPFIVAAPQCPVDVWWQADRLGLFLDYLIEEFPIDENRVYVTGLSMGGYGTWALADAFPQRIAAIAPVAAPYAWIHPQNFKRVPVWCFHGALDDVVPVDNSIKMMRLFKRKKNMRFTIHPDAGHDKWNLTYENPELYEWFLRHRRKKR